MSIRPFSNKLKSIGALILISTPLFLPTFCGGQTIEPFRPGIDDAKWIEIQVDDSLIKVFGSFPTPTSSYIISSQVYLTGSLITIRAQAIEQPSYHTPLMPVFRRFFRLITAPPGEYKVMVYYTVLGVERLIKSQTVAILPPAK